MTERELLSALDGGEEHRRVLLDRGPAAPGLYLKALPKAEGAVKGRLLSVLGRREEAAEVLAAAAAEGAPRAKLWLAAEYLHSGRLEDGAYLLATLDGEPWAALLHAAALLGLGRDATLPLSTASRRGGEEAAAAAALEGLALTTTDPKRAEALFRRAAEAAAGQAWPWVLKARSARAAGDKGACLEALAQALRLERRSWVLLERSRVYEEIGDLDRALADCDAALSVDGDTSELLQRRAHIQICRRHYHLAEPDLARAAALAPTDPEPRLTRATVRLIRGELKGSVEDARAAGKVGGEEAKLEMVRFETYAGELSRVGTTLDAVQKRRPDLAGPVAFARGSVALKERRYGDAVAAYESAVILGGDGGLALKAGFHRAVALGLAETRERAEPPPNKDVARLVICGLGIKPPYTATLDALRMVAACDFVFNNLSEPEIGGLIWLLSDEGEPTMFDVRGADARWTKTIFRRVAKGRTTGFVTRGHPHVCGGLAASLIAECRKLGVEWRVYPAVSSMDTLALDALPGSAAFWGQQVLDWSTVFVPETTVDPRVPAVLYFNASVAAVPEADYLRFCARLEDLYGASHRVYFYGRTFNERPDLVPLSSLRSWFGRIDPSYTLLLPPKA